MGIQERQQVILIRQCQRNYREDSDYNMRDQSVFTEDFRALYPYRNDALKFREIKVYRAKLYKLFSELQRIKKQNSYYRIIREIYSNQINFQFDQFVDIFLIQED
ncbi:unnamed protein product [Paramecium primaurelia]|uniref:Uncharacterized protein n=1 Tax=Paramecium primaurelia TaxID=5886 RepID=A0A8S1N2W7_PARPR|nr:unnamed protein product [Paramecium primaurelia]